MKHFLVALLLSVFCFLPFVRAQQPTKEWAFSQPPKGHAKHIKQGQGLKVYWRNVQGEQISKGKLVDITDDSVYVIQKEVTTGIAKTDIHRLKFVTPRSESRGLLGMVLVVFGIIVIGLVALMQVVSGTSMIDYDLARGNREVIWPWALVGVMLVAFGIAQSNQGSEKLSKPFQSEWEIQKVEDTPKKMP